jgi:hypothetical protein
MGDATVLGIRPAHTIRINMGGWVQDWPFETVEVHGTEITISALGRRIVYYPYEHAHRLDHDTWLFCGRENFTITEGTPQPHSMDTAGPIRIG